MRNNSDCWKYYQLIDNIEVCTFGDVYKAKSKVNNQIRSIKIININQIKNTYRNELNKNLKEEN